ncbi:MAG: hypothetical protein ABSD80_05955 [Caulobacteraceae bacterium]|jgi:hypothetical protein
MKLTTMFGGLALAAIAASALAQTAPDSSAPADQNMSAPATQAAPPPPMAVPATAAGVNASTGPVPADQLPQGQATALASGDNQMVTNGPVPDTAANRAKYGGPKSHGGRATPPIGN